MLNIILRPDDKSSLVFSGHLEDRLFKAGVSYKRYYCEDNFYATNGLWLPLGSVQFEALERAVTVEDTTWTSISQTVSDVIKQIESKVVLIVGRGRTVGKPLAKILLEETNAQVIVVNSYVSEAEYRKLLCCADTVVFATTGMKENRDVYQDKVVIDISYPVAFNKSLSCVRLISKEVTNRSMDALVERIKKMEAKYNERGYTAFV